MGNPLFFIYLDPYHLDDALAVQSIAGMMGRNRSSLPRCAFVHSGGAFAERRLEAEGLFPKRNGRVLIAQSREEAFIVEQAMREVNKRIVSILTDAQVPAVGLQGSDRRLLRWKGGELVSAEKASWLGDLTAQGVVPVISALACSQDGSEIREVDPVQAMIALAESQEGRPTVVFLTRKGEASSGGGMENRDPRGGDIPDAAALQEASGKEVQTLVIDARTFFGAYNCSER